MTDATKQLIQITTKEILVRYGLGAFFAVLFFAAIVWYQLRPAALQQESMVRDRGRLMDAVTSSLERSDEIREQTSEARTQTAEASEAMSTAVENLNGTVQNLDTTMRGVVVEQKESRAVFREFTDAVRAEHGVAQDSLDEAKDTQGVAQDSLDRLEEKLETKPE